MILQATQLSETQKAATERAASRKLQDGESMVLCGGLPKAASATERQHAAELMRHQLFLLDPSERRMSIEDYAAALLEKETIA